MNQTTPQFEDRCSKCNNPVTRLATLDQLARIRKQKDRAAAELFHVSVNGSAFRWVTSCCGAAPLAVPVVKET